MTNSDIGLKDLSLGLELQEVDEVVLNCAVVGARRVRDGGEKDARLGVAVRNLLGVESGQRVVPKAEEATDLIVRDRLAHGNLLWHNTAVVVLDLPDSVLLD